MQGEKTDLVDEIKQQDKKMQLISKPFGGYRNIIDLDDVHFEDAFLGKDVKMFLQVSEREQNFNVKFNQVTNSLGMRDTKWGRLTILLFGFWTIATSFVCFQKADFLNVSSF